MKNFFICLMMASAMTAQAQIARFSGKTALEEIAADKFLAAGNMADYDRLTEKYFSKYAGFRGIVQQWIFAAEVAR